MTTNRWTADRPHLLSAVYATVGRRDQYLKVYIYALSTTVDMALRHRSIPLTERMF